MRQAHVCIVHNDAHLQGAGVCQCTKCEMSWQVATLAPGCNSFHARRQSFQANTLRLQAVARRQIQPAAGPLASRPSSAAAVLANVSGPALHRSAATYLTCAHTRIVGWQRQSAAQTAGGTSAAGALIPHHTAPKSARCLPSRSDCTSCAASRAEPTCTLCLPSSSAAASCSLDSVREMSTRFRPGTGEQGRRRH